MPSDLLMIPSARSGSFAPHPKGNGRRVVCADWRTSATNHGDVFSQESMKILLLPKCTNTDVPVPSLLHMWMALALAKVIPSSLQFAAHVQLTIKLFGRQMSSWFLFTWSLPQQPAPFPYWFTTCS